MRRLPLSVAQQRNRSPGTQKAGLVHARSGHDAMTKEYLRDVASTRNDLSQQLRSVHSKGGEASKTIVWLHAFAWGGGNCI